MRVERRSAGLSIRRRRRTGCVSYMLILSVMAGAAVFTWLWLNRDRGSVLQSADERLNEAAAAFSRGELGRAIALSQMAFNSGLAASPERYRYAAQLVTRALIFESYSDYDRASLRESALRTARTAHQRMPRDADLTAVYAYALAVSGYAGDAADAAQSVLETQPDHALARVALALAYSRIGRHDLALQQSVQAVQQAAGDVRLEALRAFGIASSNMGDDAAAARALDEAIRMNPGLVSLYFERALYALQVGDADAATVAYYQVLTLQPNNAKGHLRLCELSTSLREHEASVRNCTAVTALAPTWADGWLALGREYFLNGNFEEAQRSFHECASLQIRQNVPIGDRHFECWYLQGQAAQLNGDCAGLVTTYLEFRQMAADEAVSERWVYPPDGPPGCTEYMPSFRPAFEPTPVFGT